METQKEKELFHLISEGDESAFESLFHLYAPRLQPVIRDVIKTEAHVKDVLQEIFLDLWVSRHRLPEVEVPRNWIFRITYNRSYRWVARQLSRDKLTIGLDNNTGLEAGEHTTTDQYAFNETSRLIREAIKMLAPRSLHIYRMSREEGFKPSEIATALGITPQSVKNSLQRSNIAIREFLLKNGVNLPAVILMMTLSGISENY